VGDGSGAGNGAGCGDGDGAGCDDGDVVERTPLGAVLKYVDGDSTI